MVSLESADLEDGSALGKVSGQCHVLSFLKHLHKFSSAVSREAFFMALLVPWLEPPTALFAEMT